MTAGTLLHRYGLSKEQSEAILAMQLRRLTALERESLQEEATTLKAAASGLRVLLTERPKLLQLLSDELAELKAKFGTPRRTQLGTARDAELSESDLLSVERCIIVKSVRGYMKRLPLAEFEAQNRGTRGKAGMANLRDGDDIQQIIQCGSHDTLLCLTEQGVAYALPAYKVPASSRISRGVLAHQLLPLGETDKVGTILSVSQFSSDVFLVLLTRKGFIKKTPLQAFSKITARGLTAVGLGEGDSLVRASLCSEGESVILCSTRGQAVRFETDQKQLRATGRTSRGVKSMRMREGDRIADMFVGAGAAAGRQQLVAITQQGYGKRVLASKFKNQARGGKGVIAVKFKRKDDELLALSPASSDEELLLITQKGTIVRQAISGISLQSRATTGVQLQKLDADDLVASVAIVPMDEEEEDGGEAE
jgi:DNA gyrase subunit A